MTLTNDGTRANGGVSGRLVECNVCQRPLLATCACTADSSRKSPNAADPAGRETDPAAGVAEGEEAAEVEV
jgi:hypothetical protein